MSTIVSVHPSNVDKLMMDAVSDREFVSVGNPEVLKDYYDTVDKVFEPLHESELEIMH